MPHKRKLQVFVSLTYKDLHEERQAAVQAILTAGHIPAGMELFAAGDESQMIVIKRWIDESDVYLLILGGRYGSIEPNTQKSYTQLEYDYAVERRKPLFAVVIHPDHLEEKVKSLGTKAIERDNSQKLREFQAQVETKMVKFWRDPRDIKLAILETLAEFSEREDLKGWVPSNESLDTGAVAEQMTRLAKENADLRKQILNLQSAPGIHHSTLAENLGRATTPAMLPMVSWYDPGQLAQTALYIMGMTFGFYPGNRSALLPQFEYQDTFGKDPLGPTEGNDYSNREELWMDYVADTGDGWDSTYSVAYYLTCPEIDLGPEVRNQLSEILIMGGDKVFPVADLPTYRLRLEEPYEAATNSTVEATARVFAIPGNNDWHDNLLSFRNLFSSKRSFASWKARQRRNYFAVKLPHRWWLIGTTLEPYFGVDSSQTAYFQRVAKQMNEGDRIILCADAPHWIYEKIYYDSKLYGYDSQLDENNLLFLENKVFEKQKVAVHLSGGLHHYRRHATESGFQKITAGGGGAFLHPTHGNDVKQLAEGYELKKSFPAEDVSRILARRNFLFPFINPTFGLLTATLYLLTAWAAKSPVGQFPLAQYWNAIKMALSVSMISPVAVFWIVAMVCGFIVFTDTHSRWYRWIAGALHGLSHLVATFFIGWLAGRIGYFLWYPDTIPKIDDVEFLNWPRQLILTCVLLCTLGWLVGSLIIGVYLFLSLNFFGRHSNEAFSSLRIPDFKNFVRLRIDSNGNLTMFPIGIRRVARKWKRTENRGGAAFVPDDPRATKPELIEPPIIIEALKH